jgi:hypothetical protein
MGLTAKILGGQACKQESGEAEIKHLLGFSSQMIKTVAQRTMIEERAKDNLEKALRCQDMRR